MGYYMTSVEKVEGEFVCPHCGELIQADDLGLERWAQTMDSPEERWYYCPSCEEEISEEDRVRYCEICHEPLYREKNGIYEHIEDDVCDECNEIIDEAFNELFMKLSADLPHGRLPLDIKSARRYAFERAEKKDWYDNE